MNHDKQAEFTERAKLIEKSVEWWEKEFNLALSKFEEAETLGDSEAKEDAEKELMRVYRRCRFEQEQMIELEAEMLRWAKNQRKGIHFEVLQKKNGKK